MEAEDIKSYSAFITHDVLTETQEKLEKRLLDTQKDLKDELSRRMYKGETTMEKLGDRVEGLDDKVDDLKIMVLPLLAATEATAKNTERMAVSFDEFAKSQSIKNDTIFNRVSAQDVTIEGLKHITNGITDKKKYNVAIVVAAIGVVATLVTGIFNLAPIVIPYLFD